MTTTQQLLWLWWIAIINAFSIVSCSLAFVPSSSLKFVSPPPKQRRVEEEEGICGRLRLSASQDSDTLSFSQTPITTTIIEPNTPFGPFGSGGTITGFSKYPQVRQAFEENFAQRLELGSQLVVYQNGTKIVDLYGYSPETLVEGKSKTYDGDTIQVVASSGKNMEAIAMAMLVDRGLVNYNDPVQKHWPEFGANGKDQITIADVMRHAGGVPFVLNSEKSSYLPIPITTEDIFQVLPMEEKICNTPRYLPENDENSSSSTCCYHAYTRGFLVNGILRRVDPSRRSLSQFLREEVTDPLSQMMKTDEEEQVVRFFCGVPIKEQPNHTFAPLTLAFNLYALVAQFLPALFGFNPQLKAYLSWFLRRDGFRSFASAVVYPFPTLLFTQFLSTPQGRSIEISSAGMHANARSIALINAAAMMEGSIGGVRLMSPETVEASMGDVQSGKDSATGAVFGFTKGGYGQFSESFREECINENDLFHPDDKVAYGNFVGWGGVGGSLSLVDRERKISFAYCPNGFGSDALWGIRTRRILLKLQEALEE